jgi:uncharacterized protein YdeI (YjbR/CyaY-like superfamily)
MPMTAKSTKKSIAAPADIPIQAFRDAAAWEVWLAKNQTAIGGIWMRIAKKASGKKSVTYPEALEVALCYGWIDGLKRPESETAWLQKFTPRRARSIWSQINRDKALALIENGRMKPAGLAEIERARENGCWDSAYASPSSATMTPELEAALEKSPRARAFFQTLSRANRYAILWRVQTAKKAETKTKRIRAYIQMLEKGETIH